LVLEAGESTTVVIVGGGVAGLTAAMLLRRSGVGCVVLERQPRARVEARQRAGLVEYRGIRMFEERELGRLLGDFPADNRLEIRVDGVSRFFGDDPYTSKRSGRLVPQQTLVRNLIRAFIEDGGDLHFEAADVALDRLDTERPVVRYVGAEGAVREIACDFVAGCDGDHGVTNASVPDGVVTVHEHDYGITGWPSRRKPRRPGTR
jgi:p-hydroxybenzoate 3-monooxygenase